VKARLRLADGAHDAPLDVGCRRPAVEDLAGVEIVKSALIVNRSAPRLVRFAEGIVAANGRSASPTFQRFDVDDGAAPERRDLDHLAAAEEHVHETKSPPDDARVAEQPAHVLGAGVGRDVEVFRPAIEQQIAHAAPHEISLKTVPRQTTHDLLRVGVDT
jgi:hypothetical protein